MGSARDFVEAPLPTAPIRYTANLSYLYEALEVLLDVVVVDIAAAVDVTVGAAVVEDDEALAVVVLRLARASCPGPSALKSSSFLRSSGNCSITGGTKTPGDCPGCATRPALLLAGSSMIPEVLTLPFLFRRRCLPVSLTI